MENTLSSLKLHEQLLPFSDDTLFSSAKNARFPSVDSAFAKEKISAAEKLMPEEIKALPLTLYMDFTKTGNRINFESEYLPRRENLITLTIAECIERKGRFLPRILDYAWAILEETTWILPAHNNFEDKDGFEDIPTCYDSTPWYLDLFSAETGACLATVYHLLYKDISAAFGKTVLERIEYELNRRIITPFLSTDKMWWMGLSGRGVNNWNPWISSNVLTVLAAAVKDDGLRKKTVEKVCRCLDIYAAGIPADGSCDEGVGYWYAAGGAFFDCLELLHELTGGADSFFKNPHYRNMAEYVAKVHIGGDYNICYADNHTHCSHDGLFLHRMGEAFGSDELCTFGAAMYDKFGISIGPLAHRTRAIRNIITDTSALAPGSVSHSKFMLLPDMQLCAMRQSTESDNGFYVWLKGGHNEESHNHNDVGSVGIYCDGKPFLIDIGIGVYTKDTFTPSKRYTLFPIRSCDHNIPVINGRGQLAGKEYHTDFFTADEAARSVSAGLRSAYEREADIADYTRSLRLTDDAVYLDDDITLNAPGDVVFNFYTPCLPSVSPDKVSFENGVVIEYPESLIAKSEDIMLNDVDLEHSWGTDKIYRLSFTPKEKAASFKSELVFRKKQKNDKRRLQN